MPDNDQPPQETTEQETPTAELTADLAPVESADTHAARDSDEAVLFARFIRDPRVKWFGPQPCETCGALIVKSSEESGGVELDAEDYEHHHPNFDWQRHDCSAPPE